LLLPRSRDARCTPKHTALRSQDVRRLSTLCFFLLLAGASLTSIVAPVRAGNAHRRGWIANARPVVKASQHGKGFFLPPAASAMIVGCFYGACVRAPLSLSAPVDCDRETQVATGTVKWFNPTKGYGFIQPQGGGGKDVFVHISAVERAGLSTLNEGQTVDFELVTGRNGKSSAENLKVK
jgi:CspA family cold shock protein